MYLCMYVNLCMHACVYVYVYVCVYVRMYLMYVCVPYSGLFLKGIYFWIRVLFSLFCLKIYSTKIYLQQNPQLKYSYPQLHTNIMMHTPHCYQLELS